MQIIQKAQSTETQNYILTIARGEEVFEKLLEFFKKENIVCSTFNGLGAVNEIEIAYYNLQTKNMKDK